MLRSDLRTQARNLLNETAASFWTDVELHEWINWAIRELASLIRVETNSATVGNTVNGTGTLALAAGVSRILHVRCNTDPLRRVELIDVLKADTDLTATGTPTHFWVTTGSTGALVVNWWPIPDAVYAYVVYGTNTLSDLAADADSPAIPPRHHPKLISKVLALAYAKGGRDYGASTGWEAQWQRERNEIVADLINTRDDGYVVRYVDPERADISSTFNPLAWP